VVDKQSTLSALLNFTNIFSLLRLRLLDGCLLLRLCLLHIGVLLSHGLHIHIESKGEEVRNYIDGWIGGR
jgi:hypothetical protein